VVDADGALHHGESARLAELLRPGDLLVANDAATIPASLTGRHGPTGVPIEVRLAGRHTLAPAAVQRFTAVVFGEGDHRTRTEDRPSPPALHPGDDLALGPLRARVARALGHPRLVELHFEGTADAWWEGIARYGRPIQYAHVPEPLALWDVWTKLASPPVAFEAPSAAFVLDWCVLAALRARGVSFATITLAAGISSTGDAELDRRLPLDEPYRVPPSTADAVTRARAGHGRVVALGTTVVRALEDAAMGGQRVRSGSGVATRRIGPETALAVVDALITGVHEPGESHFELLRAFASDGVLSRALAAVEAAGYRSHEFGDSMLIERNARSESTARAPNGLDSPARVDSAYQRVDPGTTFRGAASAGPWPPALPRARSSDG
jgi:S-adenosylmethionine:tRNA ribosyltransferase-isomerase